jgi:DNA-binding IclR family transcriptional regulator
MKAVGMDVFCLEMVESPLSLRCSFSRGRSQPLIRGASAKALLAFLPQDVCNAAVDHFLGNDEDRRRALLDELATIREQRYATSESEVDAGVWGVSVPVFSPGPRLECSISLMVPTVRVGTRAQEFIEQTIETAEAVTAALA